MAVYILGAGAMARETLGIYAALGKAQEVAAFVEVEPVRLTGQIRGKPVLDVRALDSLPPDSSVIAALGSPERKRWIEKAAAKMARFDTAIHPCTVIGEAASVGEGSIVCAGVVLSCDVTVGRHCIINIGATVSHDCRMEDFVTVGPGVNVAGNVSIGEGCWLGVGAKVVNNISIGAGSYIAAGAVVTADVPAGVLALGVPARAARPLAKSDWKELT